MLVNVPSLSRATGHCPASPAREVGRQYIHVALKAVQNRRVKKPRVRRRRQEARATALSRAARAWVRGDGRHGRHGASNARPADDEPHGCRRPLVLPGPVHNAPKSAVDHAPGVAGAPTSVPCSQGQAEVRARARLTLTRRCQRLASGFRALTVNAALTTRWQQVSWWSPRCADRLTRSAQVRCCVMRSAKGSNRRRRGCRYGVATDIGGGQTNQDAYMRGLTHGAHRSGDGSVRRARQGARRASVGGGARHVPGALGSPFVGVLTQGGHRRTSLTRRPCNGCAQARRRSCAPRSSARTKPFGLRFETSTAAPAGKCRTPRTAI